MMSFDTVILVIMTKLVEKYNIRSIYLLYLANNQKVDGWSPCRDVSFILTSYIQSLYRQNIYQICPQSGSRGKVKDKWNSEHLMSLKFNLFSFKLGRFLNTSLKTTWITNNTNLSTRKENTPSLGGLEPPTFRLTAERANRLRHRDHMAHNSGASCYMCAIRWKDFMRGCRGGNIWKQIAISPQYVFCLSVVWMRILK